MSEWYSRHRREREDTRGSQSTSERKRGKIERREYNDGSLLIPREVTPLFLSLSLAANLSGKRNERKECPRIFSQAERRGEHRQRADEVTKEVGKMRGSEATEESEGESVGPSVCPSVSSSSPPRSTILRHSRRGLITACHCCHGNSRSVKNFSALTPIVRLKFHGERVRVRPPGPKRLGKYLCAAARCISPRQVCTRRYNGQRWLVAIIIRDVNSRDINPRVVN